MLLNHDPVAVLTQIPVRVQSEWIAKFSATRPPLFLPHTQHTLHCRLTAAEPFLLVWMIGNVSRLEYSRGLLDDAATGFVIALLQLEDWERDRPAALGFGGEGVGIDAPAELHTGIVYDWAVDPMPSGSTHQMLLVARRDVENVRGRWRIQPGCWSGLPPTLAFLQHGRRTGTIKADR